MIFWTGDLVGAGPIKALPLVVSSYLGSYYHVSHKLVLAFALLFRMKTPWYEGKKGILQLFLEKIWFIDYLRRFAFLVFWKMRIFWDEWFEEDERQYWGQHSPKKIRKIAGVHPSAAILSVSCHAKTNCMAQIKIGEKSGNYYMIGT